MKYLSVKNFDQYQHYKDRRPPWIKLYASVLDEYDIAKLKDAAKAHLFLLWLLASQTENKIPHDAEFIARKIGATEPIDLDALLAAGFLVEWSADQAFGRVQGWASRHVPDAIRERLLAEAKHRCPCCGSRENLEVDHIIPISQGGTSDPSNLQVLCRTCNRKKRARLSHSAQQATQPRSDLLRSDTAAALLETETETETEAEKKKKRRSAASATGLDRLSKADCDALFEAWGKHWPVAYGRFRKALLVAHQAGLPAYTLQEKLDAIEAAFDWWESQPPREQKFWSVEGFVRELPKWVDYGKMPNSDARGVLTERGRWIMGRAA